jgi:putative membrane protein
MKLILRIVVIALVILAIPKFIAGISVDSFYYALIASVAFGIVNLVIRPLVGLITLPINILTLGLFGFVINAVLFWLVAVFVPGFEITSFIAAFVGSFIVSMTNWLVSKV